MALCIFVLIASEFMPVSMLTPLAHDLQVSEGGIGAGVAISGAFAVLASLCLVPLAGNIDRKTLLLSLTTLMGASGAVVALATSYPGYMVGRALIGLVIGGFWSLSAATAIQLVPSAQMPKALAIFNGGNALATLVAPPLGSYLGSLIGWRGTFFAMIPLALIALIWQWLSLPSMPIQDRQQSSGAALKLLKLPVVAKGMLAVSLFFMGQFVLFTYLRPFLEIVTHVDVVTLSLLLLTMGASGLVGTALIGPILKRSLYRTLFGITALMATIAISLCVFGDRLMFVAALLALWGLVATAAPVAWWLWIAHALPRDTEAGGGLMVAAIQLAIATGSAAGGMLFDRGGHQSAFLASAALLLIAAFVIFLTARTATCKAA